MSKNKTNITSFLNNNKKITSFLLQLLLTVSLTMPLTLGIGKLTHWFDGKDGKTEKQPTPNTPYIEDPNPSTGKNPTLIVLNSIVSHLRTPTEADLHLVNANRPLDKSDDGTVTYDNQGKYLEKPQDVWQGHHKDEPWYLSEIWWPNNSDYDFQIKNYYFNSLNFWFEKAKKELNITHYQFEMNGKLQHQSKITNNNEIPKNSTNIDLNISNRSVYGLTINSLTFSLSIKVLDQEEKKTLTLKYPKPIKVKKEVFTDFIDQTVEDMDDDENTSPPHFTYHLNGKDVYNEKYLKHSPLDIQKKHLRSIRSFKNKETNLKFLKHAEDYHSFSAIPSKNHDGINMDYMFMFNFHDLNNQNPFSFGFYLITKIHCNHTNNDGKKWIR